jgi:TPR repeat protein
VAAAAADGDSTFVPLSENERSAFCKQGVNLLLDAASNGDLQAQTNLGLVNQEAGNVHDAYKWFLAASNDGCPRATNLLGLLLLHGSGTPDGKKDEHKAYALFISASRGGDLDSLYNAGMCCENGLLSESFHQRSSPNLQLALRFYESGAAEGHLECTYSFGYLLLRQAVELLAERAPGEDRRTAVEHYLTPKEQAWYESTAAQGIHFLRIAADRGLADARYQLGRAYMAGIGVPQDVHAAYEAFQFACNSPVIVGSQEQHGGSQDWIKSGGATAHARASLEAGNILFSGFGSGFPSQQELEQAARMYAIASRAGNADAMNSLALLLEDGRVGIESPSNGDGSIKNLHEDDATAHRHARLHMAVRYYMCAATHGHADAMLNLTHLLASGAVDVGLTRGLVTLPLEHGSAGDVLLQNNPSSGATGTAKGAGSGLFGYVRGTSSSTISGGDGQRRIVLPWTEVACWLVDNAVLPEHSPLSAQDYSDALAYLERLSRSSSSGTAGPHDVNASVDNDSDYSAVADCDYLGALHRAEMESVEKAAAAAQRVDEERKAGRALVAEVMGSVKKAPPPVADIASASLTPHAPQVPSKEQDPYSPPPALAASSRAGKHSSSSSSSVSVPTSSSVEHTPMAGKYSNSSSSSGSSSSSSPRDTLSESASKTPRAGKFSSNSSAPVASRIVGRESPNPLGSEAASALEREKAAHQQAVSSFSAPSSSSSDSIVSSPGSSQKLGQARVIPVVSRSPVTEAKPTATSTSTTTAAEESKESAGTVSVPTGYSMPPSKLHSVGNKSLVGSSTGDSKPQMLSSSQPSPVPVPVVVTKSKPSKKGGSFLTSIGTDLEASTDADASISGVASPATMDRTGTGSLDLSASTMAPTPAASKSSARPAELELSEVDAAADYDEAEFSGALPSARGKGEKEEDRPPKPPKRAGAAADKPEKESAQKQLSLERPKPSASPANTGTSSAANKAAAAAMFEEVEEDDSEFEFSSMSMSRDSNLNASYASVGASVGAGGAGKLATSVDSSSRVSKGPKPKPKPPKKKTKLPPRNLASLNSSFEFDSSFG